MEHKENMENKVIKVIRTEENMIRDAAEKKNVIIYRLKDEIIRLKIKRDKEEIKNIKDILKK